MKRYLPFMLIFGMLVMLIPAAPLIFTGERGVSAEPESVENYDSESESESDYDSQQKSDSEKTKAVSEVYKVLDVSTGDVIEVSAEDYIIGAVCAEMPATFEEEALKAQAVAAHTYAERQHLRELENPTPELCGADFSNDTNKYQGYFTINQARQFFGENFDLSYNKIKNAADEVKDYIIVYGDEPIISAFHSMSSGKTESAENVWGTAVEYLVPVESEYDTDAPKYLEQTRYEQDVLRWKLEDAFPDAVLGEDYKSWIQLESRSDSGTVLTANVGGISVTGNDLRTALVLRSACMDIKYEDNGILFITKGYGHGVGMSQYGANSMALAGSTWQEIIQHYYTGCEIKKSD